MIGPSVTHLLHKVHYETLQVKDWIEPEFYNVNGANSQGKKLFFSHCPGKLDSLINLKGIKTSNWKNSG